MYSIGWVANLLSACYTAQSFMACPVMSISEYRAIGLLLIQCLICMILHEIVLGCSAGLVHPSVRPVPSRTGS